MRRMIYFFIAFYLLLSISFAEAKIEIIHRGYSGDQLLFGIKNVGDKFVTNPKIYVDGNLTRTLTAGISPGGWIGFSLSLPPGLHLIEVKTKEGAYASFSIEVAGVEKEKPKTTTTTIEETTTIKQRSEKIEFPERNVVLIGIIILIIIIVVLWLGKKYGRGIR